ncbi:hypothetical protein [Leptospira stimsonii]|uniref:Uncharacterized protein n=1 Tax=Leptospira stimsonii TaxID=2202203 RepID=A0ABY2N8W3_9LEPT|nr:hypothetical protein [Leptospira stimsonii]TGK12842.1 hypothetical protein EHO98_19580 [Leptospira stimsonii]TGM18782.1 hypothetical protein EHQ90_06465 [Leptospira stimsonii]
MSNNLTGEEKKTIKLWLQVLWLKIKGTRFTHFWIWHGEAGGILIKNYWSHWYPGFPVLLFDGNTQEFTGSWQIRIGLLGIVIVIFSEGKGSKVQQ